jgi:hypothetical protein
MQGIASWYSYIAQWYCAIKIRNRITLPHDQSAPFSFHDIIDSPPRLPKNNSSVVSVMAEIVETMSPEGSNNISCT